MSLISREIFTKLIPIFITFAVLLAAFFAPQDDIKTLLIFSLLVVIFALYRFDSRIPVSCAILLLVLTGVATAQKADDMAARLAVLCYWFLVAGLISILIEKYRKKALPKREEIT